MKHYSIFNFIVAACIMLIACTKAGESTEAGSNEQSAPKIISVISKFNGKAVYGYPITIKGSNLALRPVEMSLCSERKL